MNDEPLLWGLDAAASRGPTWPGTSLIVRREKEVDGRHSALTLAQGRPTDGGGRSVAPALGGAGTQCVELPAFDRVPGLVHEVEHVGQVVEAEQAAGRRLADRQQMPEIT